MKTANKLVKLTAEEIVMKTKENTAKYKKDSKHYEELLIRYKELQEKKRKEREEQDKNNNKSDEQCKKQEENVLNPAEDEDAYLIETKEQQGKRGHPYSRCGFTQWHRLVDARGRRYDFAGKDQYGNIKLQIVGAGRQDQYVPNHQ